MGSNPTGGTIPTTAEAVDWVCTALGRAGYAGPLEVCELAANQGGWTHGVRFVLHPDGASADQALDDEINPLRRVGLVGPLEVGVAPATASAASSLTLSDGVRIVVAARTAFGTGLHPATLGSLRLVALHARPGVEALDLGSGSGVLAAAMALAGARVLALDNDPIAVEATRATVRLNCVERLVETRLGSLGRGSAMGSWMGGDLTEPAPRFDPTARFDLIAANILARVHTELAGDYAAALKPGAVLITAGYDTHREAEVDLALRDEGLVSIARVQIGDYVVLGHRRG